MPVSIQAVPCFPWGLAHCGARRGLESRIVPIECTSPRGLELQYLLAGQGNRLRWNMGADLPDRVCPWEGNGVLNGKTFMWLKVRDV